MDYTTTYFLLFPSMECRNRTKSEMLNISLVLSCALFYTALPVLENTDCFTEEEYKISSA